MIKSHFRRPPSLSHGENSTTQGHCRSRIGRVFQLISCIMSNLNLQKKTRLTNMIIGVARVMGMTGVMGVMGRTNGKLMNEQGKIELLS